MSFYILNTANTVETYFQSSTQTLPINFGYTINGNSLKFVFYMFGIRNRGGYSYKNNDLAYYFQRDTFTKAIELGAYNFNSNWALSTTNSPFINAKWIWSSSNAHVNANGNSDGFYYWFYYTFYYNGTNTSGMIYVACSSVVTVLLNSASVLTLADNSISNNIIGVTLIPNNLNYIRIAAYNPGYGGGKTTISITTTNAGISTNGLYTIYTFTSNGSITIYNNISFKLLLVGGGGYGENGSYSVKYGGGGGGGGNVYYNNNYSLSGQSSGTTYTVTVGNGGVAGTTTVRNGQSTVFNGIVILGGGGGGIISSNKGNGGGISRSVTGSTGITGVLGSATYGGMKGGIATNNAQSVGAGGGAGCTTNGSNGALGPGGAGGNGFASDITGSSVTYGSGGGGGGGSYNNVYYSGGAGGTGGGAGGTAANSNNNSAGGNATGYGGGGGGGGSTLSFPSNGGNGGGGIAIFSILTSLIANTTPNNPAGLICSVYDSNSTNIANTNNEWAYSNNSDANVTTTNYSTVGSIPSNNLV